jgi:hypothetical protein
LAQREGLLSLTLSCNGDPIDPELIDGFAWQVKERFRARHGTGAIRPGAATVTASA